MQSSVWKKKEKKSKKRKVKDDFDERKTMIDFEERVIQVLNLW